MIGPPGRRCLGAASCTGYHPEIAAVHRRHNARLAAIIAGVGWPGRTLVGDDGCRAAGFVIQHAILDPRSQCLCLPLLETAVGAGEAFPPLLAFLTDRALTARALTARALMERGQPQRYGTQHVGGPDGTLVPWPISEPETVEARRLAVGLDPLTARTAELRQQVADERGHAL